MKLKITITSFSYKKGIPANGENGGGHVFDCRCIPNPGREARFANLCGKDTETIEFLNAVPEARKFFKLTRDLVKMSVSAYLDRGFSSLLVAYGCTGGQHRSVYMAEQLAKEIESANVEVEIIHRELGALK